MTALVATNLGRVSTKKLGQPTLSDAIWARALPVLRAKVGRGRPVTQKALAEGLGVSQPTVSAWLHSETRPTLTNLVAALRFLGEDPAKVLPEIAVPSDATPNLLEVHARLKQLAAFLSLDAEIMIAGWDLGAVRSAPDGEWLDVWMGMPEFLRQAAMAAVYLWGHPMEAACEAARKAWDETPDEERARKGEHPAFWYQDLLRHLPDRPRSGTRPALRSVGLPLERQLPGPGGS